MNTVPTVGPRYWLLLCLASVFGADLGDWFAHALHLGHWRGLLPLLLAFALTFRAGTRAGAGEIFYWVAIIIVRTAATNFADLQSHEWRLPFAPLMLGYAALLAGLVAWSRREVAPGGVPRANLAFWAGMLVAGTLGTVLGDDLSHSLPGRTVTSSAISTVAVLAGFTAFGMRPAVVGFWVLVVLIRTWGTDVGDLLADRIGLGTDTLLSGVLFCTLLLSRGLGPPAPAGRGAAPRR